MPVQAEKFLAAAEEKVFDPLQQAILKSNTGTYDVLWDEAPPELPGLETARRKAHVMKWRVMENLDKFLPEFEANFQRRAGKVIWANDAAEALTELQNIIKRSGAKRVISSCPLIGEELQLNEFLNNAGLENFEADASQNVSHPPDSTFDGSGSETAIKNRQAILNKYRQADIGITGVNFLIAETGSVCLSEDRVPARLCTSLPKIHIAIAGIESVIPSLNDLGLFLPLLAAHNAGRKRNSYSTILNGPRKPGETDGPEEMYVVLLDNGRTNLLAQKEQRQGLYCIGCGACLNVCPVYQTIGGQAYGTPYTGPIGSVITPHLQGMNEFKHLSQASTLCGRCSEVCPVKIDLHKMLLLNRRDAVISGLTETKERWGWSVWKKAMLDRKALDFFGSGIKNFILKRLFEKTWGRYRKMPVLTEKTFTDLWKEKNQNNPA